MKIVSANEPKKVTARDLLNKLTTRNVMALSTTAVLLFAVVFVLLNSEKFFESVQMIEDMESPSQAFVIGGIGGTIFGVFLSIAKDVYQFFFRTSGPKPPE